MDVLQKKDVEEIVFETLANGCAEQFYAIHTNTGEVIRAAVYINKGFDVVVKCDKAISQEVEDDIYIEALSIWRENIKK